VERAGIRILNSEKVEIMSLPQHCHFGRAGAAATDASWRTK
jgi:hypothetical protein